MRMWAWDCGPNVWCEWGTEPESETVMFRWDDLEIKLVYVVYDVAVNNGLAIDGEGYGVVAKGANDAGFVK